MPFVGLGCLLGGLVTYLLRPVKATVLKSECRDVGAQWYQPFIEFEYTVDGQQYRSDSSDDLLIAPALLRVSKSKDKAENGCSHYSVGSCFTAYYLPFRPTQVSVDRHLALGTVALVFGCFGLLLWLYAVFVS